KNYYLQPFIKPHFFTFASAIKSRYIKDSRVFKLVNSQTCFFWIKILCYLPFLYCEKVANFWRIFFGEVFINF
ncbi:hypothetical protein, partial [Lactobacillus delbrueckii]|uniref:hypothetical protein n=2 Tax=Lactobacillus delbrueckii TaxID=1584 RepID=UPI001C640681